MREYARSNGWWDGKTGFNFATVYSYLTTARIESAGSRYCEGKKLLEQRNGGFLQSIRQHWSDFGGKKGLNDRISF